jgi:hypothetical protein
MRTAILAGVLCCVAGASAAESPASRPAVRAKRLIEFGWDEPDTSFMRRHVDQLKRSPFDGCVFHVNYARPGARTGAFTWECWSKRAFTVEDVQAAADDLKHTDFGRFRYNFLRFNTTPADVDWFDDYSAILNNAKLAARLAREGGCPGLLFDIEQYNEPLFNYRKQRDAKTKSWEVYAAQARKRGREVMAAFQEGFPSLEVLLTFGYCLPWGQSDDGKKPLADCSYGLLAPFMNGLVEAARGSTRLIDGNESAYGYRTREQFVKGRRTILEDVLPMVADREKYQQVISVSFGLWMDYDWRKQGWHPEDVTRNPHTPEAFEQVTSYALEAADEYVWIYTETPRWWSQEGGPVKLPEAYDRALRAAREHAGGVSRPGARE